MKKEIRMGELLVNFSLHFAYIYFKRQMASLLKTNTENSWTSSVKIQQTLLTPSISTSLLFTLLVRDFSLSPPNTLINHFGSDQKMLMGTPDFLYHWFCASQKLLTISNALGILCLMHISIGHFFSNYKLHT